MLDIEFNTYETNKECTMEQFLYLKNYLELGNSPNIRYNNSFLLLEACLSGDLKVVKLLLEAGADVNIQDRLRASAAMLAANTDILKLLISYNIDLNTQDFNGNTALHWSFYLNDDEQVHILLAHGADRSIKNKKGFYFNQII